MTSCSSLLKYNEGSQAVHKLASFPGLPPFLFFSLPERKPKNKKWERPGNEASCKLLYQKDLVNSNRAIPFNKGTPLWMIFQRLSQEVLTC